MREDTNKTIRASDQRGGASATLVLGVHRSGTSLITAGLKAIGCDLGEFNDVPNEENPRGFFEHSEFRRFNDELMTRRLDVSWDNWGFRADAFDLAGPSFAKDRAAAGDLLKTSFSGNVPFALKDPRIASLLPFWEAVLRESGTPMQRILIVRDPVEVARSQVRRAIKSPSSYPLIKDFSAMHALWCVTMYTVLSSVQDDHTLVIAHSDLYEKTQSVLHKCAEFIGLSPAESDVTDFAENFVEPSLRRASTTEQCALEEQCDNARPDPWQAAACNLYRALASSNMPRELLRDEARKILFGQKELGLLLSTLDPVRLSLSAARSMAKDARKVAVLANAQRIKSLRLSLDLYSEFALRHATGVKFLGQVDALTAYADESPDRDILALRLAQIWEGLGEHSKAESLYREIWERSPRAAKRLGSLLKSQGRAEEFEEVQLQAKLRFPNQTIFDT